MNISQELMNSFTIIIGLINILLLVFGVWMTIRHFKLVRTFNFIERYNSDEYRKHKVILEFFIKENGDLLNSKQKLINLINSKKKEDIDVKTSIFKFLYLLQEIAVAYKLNILHKRTFINIIGSIIPRYYSVTSVIIETVRECYNDSTIFNVFEEVAEEINKKEFNGKFSNWNIGTIRDSNSIINPVPNNAEYAHAVKTSTKL